MGVNHKLINRVLAVVIILNHLWFMVSKKIARLEVARRPPINSIIPSKARAPTVVPSTLAAVGHSKDGEVCAYCDTTPILRSIPETQAQRGTPDSLDNNISFSIRRVKTTMNSSGWTKAHRMPTTVGLLRTDNSRAHKIHSRPF